MAQTVLEVPTKSVPLDEALGSVGGLKYATFLALLTGLFLFTGLSIILMPSYVIPAAACDLELSLSEKGTLLSSFFVGMIFSSHLVGYFADSYGRRTVILGCSFITALLLAISSFTPNFNFLFVIWTLAGLLIAGIISPSYVYITEFCPVNFRAKALLISSAVASLATTFQPGLAWLIIPIQGQYDFFGLLEYSSWRFFISMTALLSFLCGLTLVFLPESPKFLLSRDREEESMEVLKLMYRFNTGNNKEEFQISSICLGESNDNAASNKTISLLEFGKLMVTYTLQLFTPPLLIYTVVASALQFGIVGVYNVIMMWVPDFVNKVFNYGEQYQDSGRSVCDILMSTQENININMMANGTIGDATYQVDNIIHCNSDINTYVFITNIFIGSAQFIFFTLASSVTSLMGPKNYIILALFIAAVCSSMLTWFTWKYAIFSSMGAIVVLLSSALPVSISIVVDLFPTYIRSMGSCMCMVFGRIGVVSMSQFFSYFIHYNCNTGYYVISTILAGICILVWYLPLKKNSQSK